MGVYQMLERRFDEVIAKTEKSVIERERKFRELDRDVRDGKKTQAEAAVERHAAEADSRLALSSEELAIADMLSGRPTIKVHVHKEDDALYLIQLAKRYGLKVTADHLSDVNHREIFDELAKAGIPIVYGPLGSLSYKVELKHDRWQNAGLLLKSKAYFGLMTDHPVVMTYNLRDTLKFFMVHGMSDADAIGLITRRNAEILGLKDLGTLEEGKLASLLVWDRDPLHLGAMPRVVIAEGRVLRKP
jgi:imidazolonepropionase-like amidohydrolase